MDRRPEVPTTQFVPGSLLAPDELPIEPPAAGAKVPHGRVLADAALLGSLTVVAKLAALGKDWLVARQLGAGDALDAYLVAFLLPSFCAVVLAHSFASAFIPSYVRVWRQHDLRNAQGLLAGVMAWGLATLAIVTLAMVAVEGPLLPLLGQSFGAEKLALARALFYPMVPIVGLSGLSAMLAAVLAAHHRFAAAAAAPLAIAAGTLLLFWAAGERWGAAALAYGTTLGFAAELAVLLVAAGRAGLLVAPRAARPSDEVRRVGRQYLPIACGGLLMSGTLVINQSMAASLGSGQLSVFNYGGKIVVVVVGVLAASLSTVMLPRFSHLIAAGQFEAVDRTFRRYAAAILAVSIPLVAVLALVSEPLIRWLFERGAFTPDTTAAVSAVQLCLLPQIPFYVLAMLGARLLSALDGNPLVLAIGALNLGVNVAANVVLMRWLGVRGIALATTLVYVAATVATLAAVYVKLARHRRASPHR